MNNKPLCRTTPATDMEPRLRKIGAEPKRKSNNFRRLMDEYYDDLEDQDSINTLPNEEQSI